LASASYSKSFSTQGDENDMSATQDMWESIGSTVGTFMNVPMSRDLSQCGAAFLGIPFDCGLNPVRLGARMGPRAIREQSSLVRPYQPPLWDTNLLEAMRMVDCGDVNVVHGDILESFARIESCLDRFVESKTTPITFGGDGSVTLPQLRALHRAHPDLVVLHIDAHTDTYPDAVGEGMSGTNYQAFNPATTFSRAAEEGVVDAAGSMHVGARGSVTVPGVFDHTRHLGFELISGLDMMEMGIAKTLGHIHERLRGKPVYLCWDMDFFDPSCAPGVYTPTWGGATAREGLTLLQGLKGLDIVATDVNTLSPLHDVGGMSAFLAATCVLECIGLVHAAIEQRA